MLGKNVINDSVVIAEVFEKRLPLHTVKPLLAHIYLFTNVLFIRSHVKHHQSKD